MKKLASNGCRAVALAALLAGVCNSASLAQEAPQMPVLDSSDYLRWPAPAGADAKYAAIDGHRMWGWVEEQAKIARDYRDQGHQWWGRIVGTSGDEADVQWLLGKYKEFGLSDAHAQIVALFDPQWSAKSWSVSLTGGGKNLNLESAQPAYGSPSADGKEVDLEVVYVGGATEADFVGRNVQGKAVVFEKEHIAYNFDADTLKRIMNHGAAAILGFDARGENHKAQSYRTDSNVPIFDLGTEDGNAIRDAVATAAAGGAAPHLKIRLDAEWVPNQKSYLVWGTLPGMTDETIYVIAHRDGWFEAAADNASGVATMLGLAEYYSKVPKERRKRTMIFIGEDGHHQVTPGWYGTEWLAANRDRFFKKTALFINAEHTGEVLTHGNTAGITTAQIPLEWYAGGPQRPQLQKIATDSFHEFGVPIWDKPSVEPPAGDLWPVYHFLPGAQVQSNDYMNMHTDIDNPATVSWAGLESTTRAYAKIVDEVNKLPLADLQRPAEVDPHDPNGPAGWINLKNCQAWIKDSSQPCTH